MNIKTKYESRIEAYELLNKLKQNSIPKKEAIAKVSNQFGIPYGTLYGWYKYDGSPFGKRKIRYNKELFYVLGALLGDGCHYYWKKGDTYTVIIAGEKEFINKYSEKLSICTGKKIKGYLNRSNNTWHLTKCSIELYLLFKKIRENLDVLESLIKKGNYYENSLEFVEGFFDAEGCVKIIKEEVRITPKICLDMTNTDKRILDIIQKLLKGTLSIDARYSIQKADGMKNKQVAYHLRIYKKEFVRKFFENISTIKLKEGKISYVENWLKRKNKTTLELDCSFLRPASSLPRSTNP